MTLARASLAATPAVLALLALVASSAPAAGGARSGDGASTAAATPAPAEATRGARGSLALARRETRPTRPTAATLEALSPSIPTGGLIPARHAAQGGGISPAIDWSPVPGARSYALIVEDADSPGATPFVHWVAWNIPATVTHLPEHLPAQRRLARPAGMRQGASSVGSPGWFGPLPPPGDAAHHYHFQVLALDASLTLPSGADRDALLGAAQGHVIARGEFVGRYASETAPGK